MVAPLDPIKPVPCTLPTCYLSFATTKEMRRHKKEAPDHFYCRKCDVDCLDWADLTWHKVEAMAPWVEGRHVPGTQPAHIVCEFCGEDFKSLGGRRAHREKMHPADQDIVCPGEMNGIKCGEKFTRAAGLVYHLEEGMCEMIKSSDFYAHIQKKEFVRQIYEDAEKMSHVMEERERTVAAALIEGPSEVVGADEFENLAGGGEKSSKPALSNGAEDDLIDLEEGGGVKIDAQAAEHWPPLSPDRVLAETTRELTLGPGICDPSMTYSERAKPDAHHFEPLDSENHWPPITSLSNTSARLADQDTSTRPAVKASSSAWKTNSSSKALPLNNNGAFPPSHNTTRWTKLKSQQLVSQIPLPAPAPAEEPPTPRALFDYLTNARDIDLNVFRDPISSRYVCPFLKCKADSVSFETTNELEAHIYYGHVRTVFECKACFKRFPKAHSLVAHCESTTNCPIQKSKKFQQLIDDITGGFVKTKTLRQENIYQVEGIGNQALIKADQAPVSGVLRAEFKAATPSNEKSAAFY